MPPTPKSPEKESQKKQKAPWVSWGDATRDPPTAGRPGSPPPSAKRHLVGAPPPVAGPRTQIRRAVDPARLQQRIRIMLVDDEVDILRSTEMLLSGLGFDCVAVPDHRLVQDVASRDRPDVLLLDLIMPGLDVGRVLRQLRSSSATSNVPVVLFSASTDLPDLAAEYDVAGYLQKPFDEEQLIEVVARVTGRRPSEPLPPAPQQAPSARAQTDRLAQRQVVKEYFHDYWQMLTALNSYAQFLKGQTPKDSREREAAEEIARIVLELERKTDSLRAKLLEFVS